MPATGTINSPTGFSAYTDYSLTNLNLNTVMRRLAQANQMPAGAVQLVG